MTGTTNRPSFPAIDTSGNSGKGGWYLLTPITPISDNSANNRAGYLAKHDKSDDTNDYLKRSNFFQMLLDNMILDDQSSKSSIATLFANDTIKNLSDRNEFRILPSVYYLDHTQKNYDGTNVTDGSMNTYGFDPNVGCFPSKYWKELDLDNLSNSGYTDLSAAIDAHTLGEKGVANHEVCWPVFEDTTDISNGNGSDIHEAIFNSSFTQAQTLNALQNRVVGLKCDNPNSLLNVRVNMGTCYWVYIQKFDFPGNLRIQS